MKYSKSAIVFLVIIAIGLALYFAISSQRPNTPTVTSENKAKQADFQTQTVSDAEVKYTITPLNISSDNSKTWDFEIRLDTHSGSLDQDLVSQFRLIDDKGNEYEALNWDGALPGGHHREGILKFSPISPLPGAIELSIKTSSGEKTSLRWKL